MFVCVRFRPCAFLFVCARSFLFVGGRFRSCAFIAVWWCDVGELVEVRGRSWCRGVVAGGVVVMGRHGHSFMAVCCCGSCDVAPASHVKKEVGGGGLWDSPA